MKNWLHVGATPNSTFAFRISGLKTSANPRQTRSACVAKSTTASTTLSRVASRTPTMFSPTSRAMTTMPPTMSQGFSRRGSQKTER